MSDQNDWKALAEKELRGRAVDDLNWETLEGIIKHNGPLTDRDGTETLKTRYQ